LFTPHTIGIVAVSRKYCFIQRPSLPYHQDRPWAGLFDMTIQSNMTGQHVQDEVYASSIGDPEAFWSRQAQNVVWQKKPSKALQKSTKTLEKSKVTHDHWSWFADGEISTTYNCVDRHVTAGNGDKVAIYWDSPVTRQKEQYTYKQLLSEVETLAGVLREEGVKRGDVVLIYVGTINRKLDGAD
jgi:propionyl-CoA synthetase